MANLPRESPGHKPHKSESGPRLFVNHYHCPRCGETWQDEWSCACNDECPGCGLKDIEPFQSDTTQAMERD